MAVNFISPLNRKKFKENSKQKKFFKIACIIVINVAIATGIVMLWEKKNSKNDASQPQNELIGKYRSQLPELKKKAKSNNPEDLQNYAVAQYATGDGKGAEKTYRKQLNSGGDSASAHNNLANVLRDEKRFDEAIAEYKIAIEKDKNFLNAYFNLGSVYQYSLQDSGKAIEVFKQGIQNNPYNADLNIFLGQIYEQIDNKDEAKNAYQAAINVQSDNIAAKSALERLNQ